MCNNDNWNDIDKNGLKEFLKEELPKLYNRKPLQDYKYGGSRQLKERFVKMSDISEGKVSEIINILNKTENN